LAACGPSRNWGLATGLISGVWALDLDPKDVTDWSAVNALVATLPRRGTQRTGSGGQHWLFTLPDDFIPNNFEAAARRFQRARCRAGR
jgi:hypothetical protein